MGLKRTYKRSGFGLFVILLLLGVVSLVAAAVSLRTRSILNTSKAEAEQARAHDTAYSGLQAGLAAIERGQDDWSVLGLRTTLPNRTELAYEIKVNSNLTNTSVLVDADGTEIPPESLYLKSLAYIDDELTAGSSAIVAQERGASFNYPAFGSDTVSVENSLIEAVDSSGDTVPGEGSIRTNGTQADVISLSSGSYIDGDMTVGPGGDPVTALDVESGSGFAGDSKIAGADLPLPDIPAAYDPGAPDPIFFNIPIPVPSLSGLIWHNHVGIGVASPGTYDNFTVSPENNLILFPGFTTSSDTFLNILLLSPGDYYVNKLGSDGTTAVFSPTGETRIHVKETVSMEAATTMVLPTSSQNFQIYQTEDGGQADIANTLGRFVLSTKGSVNMVDSSVQGALYGRSVDISNSTLKYPKSLDGLALNDKARGKWNIFGVRPLNPSEVDLYR